MNDILNKHWHTLPEAEVVDSLATDLDKGLDASEVERRRVVRHGDLTLHLCPTSTHTIMLL